jgi:hypothetical protein
MPSPIPPTLSPFVKPPAPGSLTLITSVLDATSNWLLLRYIYAALRPEKLHEHNGETPENKEEELKVILVSFLRPFELWKEMGKKIVRESSLSHLHTSYNHLTSLPSYRQPSIPSHETKPLLPTLSI